MQIEAAALSTRHRSDAALWIVPGLGYDSPEAVTTGLASKEARKVILHLDCVSGFRGSTCRFRPTGMPGMGSATAFGTAQLHRSASDPHSRHPHDQVGIAFLSRPWQDGIVAGGVGSSRPQRRLFPGRSTIHSAPVVAATPACARPLRAHGADKLLMGGSALRCRRRSPWLSRSCYAKRFDTAGRRF